MALHAKMFRIQVTNGLAATVKDGMTFDTFFKRMFFGAYAAVHGLIALMMQYLHVILAHEVGIFDALVTFTFWNIGFGSAGKRRY